MASNSDAIPVDIKWRVSLQKIVSGRALWRGCSKIWSHANVYWFCVLSEYQTQGRTFVCWVWLPQQTVT